MIRLGAVGLGFLMFIALWVHAVLDVIRTDRVLVRNLPKPVWLLVVVFVPLVGPVTWLIAGRPLYARWVPGG